MPDDMNSDLVRECERLRQDNRALGRQVTRLTRDYRNITRLYEQTNAIREFNERERELTYLYNRLLLDNSPDMIFVLDDQLNFVLGTARMADALGYADARTARGMSFDTLFAHDFTQCERDIMREKLERVVRTGQTIEYFAQHERGVGGIQQLQVNLCPAIDNSGKILGALGVLHDITELIAARRAAESAAQAKSTFLANMSHEIRTPMNAIKGMADLMMATQMTDQQHSYAQNIKNAASSLLIVINDVLDFSKIDANRLELVNATYDFGSMIGDVCSMIHLRAHEKGLCLLTAIDPNIPAQMLGDDVRVRQILLNLLSNAVKFTTEGFVQLTVSSEYRGETVRLTFAVRDTGSGMRPEELSRVFNPFEQADSHKSASRMGTGLGLTISRQLIGLMGGDIRVESAYGHGSTFTFTIDQGVVGKDKLASVPEAAFKRVLVLSAHAMRVRSLSAMLTSLCVEHDLVDSEAALVERLAHTRYTHLIFDFAGITDSVLRATRALPDLTIAEVISIERMTRTHHERIKTVFRPLLITKLAELLNDAQAASTVVTKEDESLGSFQVKDARVLVVDDNQINLIVASEILKQYGIDADQALSGTEALEMTDAKQYDLIFMDHMMPDMDGIETTRALRALGGWRAEVPVIALSANAISGMREVYLEGGLNDFISKPIEISSLNTVLRQWMPKHTLHAQDTAPCELGDVPKQLLDIPDLDVKKAMLALNDAWPTYRKILMMFAETTQDKCDMLKRDIASEDLELFRTHVHGIKGSLMSLGAQKLGQIAYRLETAAQEQKREYVLANLDAFLWQLRKLKFSLDTVPELAAEQSNRPVVKGDASELESALPELLLLIDNLEQENALALAASLVTRDYGPALNESLANIERFIDRFEFDAACERIAHALAMLPQKRV